ncbi:hypothetical protein [Bacillus sp. 3255]|uniref:hypothetical protein n=1 Tax=Bacillus sp. 3255 TaxID=2817904 RepID=UPI00285FA01A|nr:hypothetical protein [Bacillus sp. 3255]MDR6885404.1 hypothetical protein [Bacillus sp. 3255]
MGVNFTATFQHSFDFKSIEKFKEELVKGDRFHNTVQCILQVNEHNPHLRKDWSINRERIIESMNFGPFDPIIIGDEEYIEVYGPGGFDFTFNKNICEFNPCFRWYSFLVNPNLQQELRNICKEIADYFGFNFSIYIGDSYCTLDYVFEGRDMDYFKEAVKRRFGESTETLKELLERADKAGNSGGYYIDNFPDLTNK